ncbi:MAG TPA: diguanylate cyclase [Candidatus Acidoferrales bacterium]|nr:diguanylate cyclase [Candidatus Acidoferrales bacterium]
MKGTRKTRKSRPPAPRDKRVHKRIEDQMHVLAQAVENSSEMIGMTDREGHFTFVNEAFFKSLRYSKDEMLGRHFGVVHGDANPKDLIREIGSNSLEKKGWRGECFFQRKDGTVFPVYLSVGPIVDRQRRVIGGFGLAKDITARRAAEASLRESEEQFRQLAENIHEVFFVVALDPVRFAYVSNAFEEVWGMSRQELYLRPSAWIDAVHPDDRERVSNFFQQSSSRVAIDMQYRLTRPDGALRWISARTFPVHNEKGELHRVVGIAEDITVRKQEEAALRAAHQKLHIALRESEQRAKEASKLSELVDILQSCQSVDEAYRIAGGALPRILTSESGALCMISPSRNVVETVAAWGQGSTTEKAFAPDTCWALRRGKVHEVEDSSSPMRCAHVESSVGGYVCVPLAAHGETLGVLYIERAARSSIPLGLLPEDQMAALARQGSAIGERVSLALATLRLRDVLRSQSIRDPLTGLFNRRYMEESLERELRRAERNGQSVGFIMLDIDHFKHFNDTFGHQAGDALLRALGDLVGERTRGQDVACRFGGEEFSLILAGASKDAASRRAELLREEVKRLAATHAGQLLGKITLSFGVAAYPGDGRTADELIRAADKALYNAKAAGRDKIMLADGAQTSSPAASTSSEATIKAG